MSKPMKTKNSPEVVVQMDPNSPEFKARLERNKKLMEERDGGIHTGLYEGGYRNRGG